MPAYLVPYNKEEAEALKQALDLVAKYASNVNYREQVINQGLLTNTKTDYFVNRAISTLVNYSPEFAKVHKRTFRRNFFAFFRKMARRQGADDYINRIQTFLLECKKRQGEINRLHNIWEDSQHHQEEKFKIPLPRPIPQQPVIFTNKKLISLPYVKKPEEKDIIARSGEDQINKPPGEEEEEIEEADEEITPEEEIESEEEETTEVLPPPSSQRPPLPPNSQHTANPIIYETQQDLSRRTRSTISDISSNTQIFARRNGWKVASGLGNIGKKTAAGLLGRGGSAALGLGTKGLLAATGIGAPIAAVLTLGSVVKIDKLIKYLVIGLFVGLVLLIYFMNLNDENAILHDIDKVSSSSGNVEVRKTGPSAVNNGQQITYDIAVSYNGVGNADIEVTDTLPQNTKFDEASDQGQQAGQTVKWNLTGISSSQSKRLQLKVTPTKDDFWAINNATARILRTSQIHDDSFQPLKILKTVNKQQVNVDDNIEFTLKIDATNLTDKRIVITDKIPTNTSFVSAGSEGIQKGDTVEWNLEAEGGQKSVHSKKNPGPNDPPAPGFGYPTQRITTTIEKIKQELEQNSTDPHTKANAQKYAEVIYNSGLGNGDPSQIVDPALVLGIWIKENGYQSSGLGFPNNPGSKTWRPEQDGKLGGMKKCTVPSCQIRGRDWGTWDTFEQGLAAIALNIREFYYPDKDPFGNPKPSQTNTWTIHSGGDAKGTYAYHGRSDIGGPDTDIATWGKYLEFYSGWIAIMDRVSTGAGYGMTKELKFTVKADVDKKWVANQAEGFSPGIGNSKSNLAVSRIGEAPQADRPGTTVSGAPTKCQGTPVSFDVPKKFLPLPNERPVCRQTESGSCGRPGLCVKPRIIVMHITTGDMNELATWDFFATGSPSKEGGLKGVGSHFIIGKDGKTIQIVETLSDEVEVSIGTANYYDHISIEMVNKYVYNSKQEVPPAQYQSTLQLVRKLMTHYNIPVGNLEWTWKALSDQNSPQVVPGIYGHYQLNPNSRTDPGAGLMRDLREDLKGN